MLSLQMIFPVRVGSAMQRSKVAAHLKHGFRCSIHDVKQRSHHITIGAGRLRRIGLNSGICSGSAGSSGMRCMLQHGYTRPLRPSKMEEIEGLPLKPGRENGEIR
jgi:hypothetical protein